jgi:hypothetical protein
MHTVVAKFAGLVHDKVINRFYPMRFEEIMEAP